MLIKTGMQQLRLIVCHAHARVWLGLQETFTTIYQAVSC